MHSTPTPQAARYKASFPSPPRVHWFVLLVAGLAAEVVVIRFVHLPYRDIFINLVIAAWPIYLCIWIRKIEPSSTALYWALASFATGILFSWLLWFVVVFEVREDLLHHYNRREPIGLRLNLLMSLFFSFLYFQFHLVRIANEKEVLLAESAEVTALHVSLE